MPPAPGAAPPDYYPPDYSKIIDASKKEPGILIYGNIGQENWKPIIGAFNKDYPWVKVSFLDLASDEVFQRYYAEQSTGSSSVDIVLNRQLRRVARLHQQRQCREIRLA